MVRLMDSIDVHNTIDTMKFSSFVADYMYDDDFRDMCDEAHIGPSDFLEQKIGEALKKRLEQLVMIEAMDIYYLVRLLVLVRSI